MAENWGGQVPALIVVDTLARAAPGQDENSARDMGRVVQSCDGFRKLYGCCVLLVHHTPKGGHDWRGSTAVWNALDTGLSVKRTGLNSATLKVERQKDGAIGQAWKIALEEVETGRERDDEKEASLVISRAEPIEQERHAQKDTVAEKNGSSAKMQVIAVDELRAQTAVKVMEAAAPNFELGRDEVLNFMMTELGPEANRGGVRRFIKAVVKKGEVQAEHPLAKYLCDINGLCFKRVVEKNSTQE